MIKITVLNKDGTELFCHKGTEIDCIYESEYQEGDKIIIHKGSAEFIAIRLDENVAENIIFAPSSTVQFEIPTGELKKGYAPDAFSGNAHRIKVREVTDEEAYGLRNIALNSHDRRGQKKYFPHAYANLVTREDVCFFECNAIDGICDNEGHGDYPYHSWAGCAREYLKYYN